MLLYQWWGDLFRCRIDLLNFSMGFNIVAPYMEFLELNWYIAEWYKQIDMIVIHCYNAVSLWWHLSKLSPLQEILFAWCMVEYRCLLQEINWSRISQIKSVDTFHQEPRDQEHATLHDYHLFLSAQTLQMSSATQWCVFQTFSSQAGYATFHWQSIAHWMHN